MKASQPLKYQDTYVYIDVSNIRAACLKTLGWRLDFVKLLEYFRTKYPNLREVRYYEGIAQGDQKKQRMFDFLARQGYIICPLERKAYNSTEVTEQNVSCPKCGNQWVLRTARAHRVMKSNVDVYLASDLLVQASLADHPVRLILVSCDGDYAEAIRNAISLNANVSVAVLATPYVKSPGRNTLSVRLKRLYDETPLHRYELMNIDTIRGYVS